MSIYYYPNRPSLIPPDPNNPLDPQPDYINSLEATRKYIAEYKLNGDNTLIYTDDFSFWNRQGKLLSYIPIPEILVELSQFPKGCILNAELVHRHTKNIKNLIVIHTVLKWENQLLLGKTWGDARALLEKQEWLPRTNGTRLDYKRHVMLSQTYVSNEPGTFWKMFQKARACDESIEGIILKEPSGTLQFSTTPLKEVSWMLKIRKPCKKYNY